VLHRAARHFRIWRRAEAVISLVQIDVEADGSHQRQRVAGLYDSVAQAVIEVQNTVFEPIFEVNVRRGGTKAADQIGECEVVRGHEADCTKSHQSRHHAFGADAAIV
jgi:hypothetical protein